jgi:hypothetical protein
MDARTETIDGAKRTESRSMDDDPLSWWRTRDPSTISPKQSLTLWFRVQSACIEAGLDPRQLETRLLVHLAIDGAPDRDLVMAWLVLKAIEGNAGAMTVIAHQLRREGAACSRLSGAWASRLLSSRRRLLPAPRTGGEA